MQHFEYLSSQNAAKPFSAIFLRDSQCPMVEVRRFFRFNDLQGPTRERWPDQETPCLPA